MIWGNAILTVLHGARQYSNYDISKIIQQIKDKKDWLAKTYPREFGPESWGFDVDEYFSRPLDAT